MGAVAACRTAALGGHVEQCDACGGVRIAYNTCRNRNCPKCQGAAQQEWLAARKAELLPVPYFHVVFTLPPAAAEIAFHNKELVYGLLMRLAAQTLATIAADPKHLGARVGLIAVLHTWGQTLTHHPHVHCITPGGGPSLDGERWVSCKPGFFLPVRALSRLFRQAHDRRPRRPPSDAGELQFFSGLAALAQTAGLHCPRRAATRSTGSSTPSRPSPGPSRFSPISRAIPIARDRQLAGSSRSPMSTSPSPIRTIAAAAKRRS